MSNPTEIPLAVHPLRYGTTPRARWTQRHTVVFFVTVLVFLGIVTIPPVVRRARIMYWERQCCRYVEPNTGALYDDSLNAATQPAPAVPACFANFDRLYHPPLSGGPIVFMHGLRAAPGEEKLVYVVAGPTSNGNGFHNTTLWLGYCEPTELFTRRMGARSQAIGGLLRHHNLKIFAGDVDPNNPAKFHIPCQDDSGSGTIDGLMGATGMIMLQYTPADGSAPIQQYL